MIGTVWAVRAVAALCVAAGVYAAVIALAHISHDDDPGPWLLPAAVGACTALLGIIAAITASSGETVSLKNFRRRCAALALLLLYAFVLLPYVGFVASAVILVIVVALFYSSARVAVGAGGLLLVLLLWGLFAHVIDQPLPLGIVFR